MSLEIQPLFMRYLSQLAVLLEKIPEPVYECSLADDMFPLATNAKIAMNFLLRGYCPLAGISTPDFFQEQVDKATVLKQLVQTQEYLQQLTPITELNNQHQVTDKAGFKNVSLGQADFINQYIIPNFMFHVSMVYAIARTEGVAVSKGDFDGHHSYPNGFSFVK